MTPTTLLLALAAVSGQPDVMVYDFTSTRCAPCQQMNPIVEKLMREGYPIQKVDIDQNRGMASQFGVPSIPTFILVVNGKEVTRIVGSTSEQSLKQLFSRVPQPTAEIKAPDPRDVPPRSRLMANEQPRIPSPPASSPTPSYSPGTRIASGLNGLERASLGSPQPFQRPADSPSVPNTQMQVAQNSVELLDRPASNPRYPESDVVIRGQAEENSNIQLAPRLDARGATVRLRISQGDQVKFGSGTVVESKPGRSIVLTCGHLFDEMNADTKIEVNVFEADKYRNYVGRLITAVPQGIDLGLVELKTDQVLPIAQLAMAQSAPAVSDRLYSLGCSRGETPTLERVDITAIDDYEGPPNLECTGMPDPGRSGGGLFNAKQELLGVCIRMNPRNERGLYTSLDPILDLLQRSDLAQLVRGERLSTIAYNHSTTEQTSLAESTGSPFDEPGTQPSPFETPAQPANNMFASATAPASAPATATHTISSTDQSLLGQIGPGSRLTILIQDPADPSQTRMVIINSASPRLISDLMGKDNPWGNGNSLVEKTTRAETVPTSQSQPAGLWSR